MRKRFEISYDGTTWAEANVRNGSGLSLKDERPDVPGAVFLRRTLDGSPILGKPEFATILAAQEDPDERCDQMLLRVMQWCSGEWNELWRGSFSPGASAWDYDRCQVTLSPKTVDRYSCILDEIEKARNILEAPARLTLIYGGPGLEWYGCTYDFIDDPPCAAPAGTGWTYISDFPVVLNIVARTWARKRVRTICNGTTPVPPTGGGWTLLSDDCASDGTATYVAGLSGGEVADINIVVQGSDLVEGTCVGGIPVPPAPVFPGVGTAWVLILPCDDPNYPGYWLPLAEAFLPTSVFGGGASRTGRTALSVMQLLTEECAGITEIQSDFLGWNPPGDAPGYVAGENYITGDPTQTEGLVIVQKSDAILPQASQAATRGDMTLTELFAALNALYRLYWDIDGAGVLRVEHWKFWTQQEGIDIRTLPGTIEPLAYNTKGDEIPRIERAKFMEARDTNFIGKDIIYSSECAASSGASSVQEVSAGRVTTDVSMLLEEVIRNTVSQDGFFFLACEETNGAYSTIIAQGALDSEYLHNAPLAWANLQRDFWTWDRYLPNAEMNGAPVVFDGFLPNIVQENVRTALCCELLDFDSKDYLVTSLGARLGDLPATVESAVYDLHNDRVTFTLKYAY
jgi:hypothetical protein